MLLQFIDSKTARLPVSFTGCQAVFLCADFLSVAKGEADVVLGVDGKVVDQSVEGVEGEFRQAVGRVLKGVEEVLVSCFPVLGLLNLLAELVDLGLELVIPVGKIVIEFLERCCLFG